MFIMAIQLLSVPCMKCSDSHFVLFPPGIQVKKTGENNKKYKGMSCEEYGRVQETDRQCARSKSLFTICREQGHFTVKHKGFQIHSYSETPVCSGY